MHWTPSDGVGTKTTHPPIVHKGWRWLAFLTCVSGVS